jgi:hypothetical protein
MVPALTVCPEYRLIPSILGLLSRPLRLVPPPFLCAIFRQTFLPGDFLAATGFDYAIDLQTGKGLPVSLFAPVAHLGLILVDNNLFCPALAGNGSRHFGSGNGGITHHYITIGKKQYPFQVYFLTLVCRQTLYFNSLAGRYPVLSATTLNNSVNF